MDIFSFLKKSNSISNEQLIPALSKTILINACNLRDGDWDNFCKVEDSVLTHSEGKIYFVEVDSAYIDDSELVFGWAVVVSEQSFKICLIKVDKKDYSIIFKFEIFEGNDSIHNVSFKNFNIFDNPQAKEKTISQLKIFASFNGYKNPPPYVHFAKMISL